MLNINTAPYYQEVNGQKLPSENFCWRLVTETLKDEAKERVRVRVTCWAIFGSSDRTAPIYLRLFVNL
jgi:hypothetical protein